MASPKRPSTPESGNPSATIVMGPGSKKSAAREQDEDRDERGDRDPPSVSNEPSVEVADEEQANDGATAFVRVDRLPPLPARQRLGEKPPAQTAPRKGLQVTLPDDEPQAPPPPKRVIAQPPPAGKKGRRGAWWDEEAAPSVGQVEPQATLQDPPAERPYSTSADLGEAALDSSPQDEGESVSATVAIRTRKPAAELRRRAPVADDDEPTEPGTPDDGQAEATFDASSGAGATAVVRSPVRRRQRPPEPEPEVAAYQPLPADDYRGDETVGPPRWKGLLQRAAVACVLLLVVGTALLAAAYVYLARQIPTFDNVSDYHPLVSTKVVTSDGTEVGQFFKERRTVVKMDQVPRLLVDAVISAEDKGFYRHPGFSVFALCRAIVVDALSGRKRIGASTITQQVVKNFFLSSEKSWKRKAKELLLAARLERNLSKDDILFLYLNHINFGKAHYGVEEASLFYFNKHVQDIDLGEAAILAGLPQNPARINPRRHPDRAKARQKYVLDQMLANRYISQEDHDREVAKPISLPLPAPEPAGAWYLEEVRKRLVEQYGQAAVETTGMRVEVAMDARLQEAAEVAMQEGLRAVDKRQGFRGAEFKLEPDKLSESRRALARKLDALPPAAEVIQIVDLEAIPEKEQLGAESIARAARVAVLEEGGIYTGLVTEVARNEATIELAPHVSGSALFSGMGWAREFKPEHATPAPRSIAEVLAVGDVVPVRVTGLQTTHDTATHLKVTRLELSLEQTPLVQGAFVGIDLKTRGVLALVGGYDAATSSFNRATQAKRQPGSSFKPFLYAAALESGKFTPATKMDDSPEVITDPWTGKTWKPQNFEKDEFAGPITLREALAQSKNTVAVKLLLDLGLDKVRTMARAAGLTSEIPQSYTAALGTGEVGVLEEVNAYATIASLGRKAEPVLIKKIVSRDGNTVFTAPPDEQQGMRADTAFLTAQLMRSVIDSPDGTAHSLAALGRTAAGKTGTASEHRDAWFVGFTPALAAGAWVGFDDHRMLGSLETGGHCAGPIWLSWMRAATKGTPPDEWPQPPPGVVEVKVNRNTGALARENDPYGVREFFISGTEPASAQEELGDPGQQEYYQEPQ